jgi:protein O-GlcNAc transferase
MTSLRTNLGQALAHHDAGRLREAEAMYREILRLHPGQPDALNLLGVMATSVGQYSKGKSLASRRLIARRTASLHKQN